MIKKTLFFLVASTVASIPRVGYCRRPVGPQRRGEGMNDQRQAAAINICVGAQSW
jgi:hypothetical protein